MRKAGFKGPRASKPFERGSNLNKQMFNRKEDNGLLTQSKCQVLSRTDSFNHSVCVPESSQY